MQEEFVIRKATLDDVEEIVRQRCRMHADAGERDPAALQAMAESSAIYLAKAIPEGTFHVWFAESRQRLVAGGAAVHIVPWPSSPSELPPRRAWIHNVYTYPEYRRRGVARLLMRMMIAWCRAEGFRSINLHATDAGRPLYESLGFKPSNEMKLRLV